MNEEAYCNGYGTDLGSETSDEKCKCMGNDTGRTFPLPFLVILLLTAFLLTCTISAHQISSLSPYALSTLPVPTLLYPEPHTSLLVHDIITLYPYQILGL
jgi:hypothetical protein